MAWVYTVTPDALGALRHKGLDLDGKSVVPPLFSTDRSVA
jgi:hypothetical protein